MTRSAATGCGDFSLSSASVLPDPCPLPDQTKKRSLNEKEKMIYAPMAGVGGVVYDKVCVLCGLWSPQTDLMYSSLSSLVCCAIRAPVAVCHVDGRGCRCILSVEVE